MDYLEIFGYKSIKSARIDLKNINILIGANGSGKSNFLSFFDFINKLYNKRLQVHIALLGGENKILHKGIKKTKEISFKLEFEKGTNGYFVELVLGVKGFIFNSEKLTYVKDEIEIARSNREALIKTKISEIANRSYYIIRQLGKLKKYHFNMDKNDFLSLTQLRNIYDDRCFLYEDGSNVSSFLYNISEEHPDCYSNIVRIIQSIAPYFYDFHFEIKNMKYVRFQWKNKYSDIVYGADALSDGTIRFILLTVLFMQPELPDTIIIDEPELGLYPLAIAKLSGMIKSVSAKGCQVIIATQSSDLISCFSCNDIITVDQVDGESKFKRLREDDWIQWLEDYTIGDLWKRNIITSGQLNIE